MTVVEVSVAPTGYRLCLKSDTNQMGELMLKRKQRFVQNTSTAAYLTDRELVKQQLCISLRKRVVLPGKGGLCSQAT